MIKQLISALVALTFSFNVANADETRGEWFRSLRQPGTYIPCCSVADCGITPARLIKGKWWVTVPDRIDMDEGQWLPSYPLRWVEVPDKVIITDKQPWDGISAYVCWVRGEVFCFIAAEAAN